MVQASSPLHSIVYRDMTLDLLWHRLLWKSERIDLTPKELRLLVALVDRVGEVCDRDYLAQQVIGVSRYNYHYSKDLEALISHLRDKLYTLTDSRSFIETVVGEGYRLRR